MKDTTRKLWDEQDRRHPGNRLHLFAAVADTVGPSSVLYPGSFVDIAPSFVFDSVTYVDIDRGATRFFADTLGVEEIIAKNRTSSLHSEWKFVHADYTSKLDLPDHQFDLLVSLYAGFVSEHCTRFLKPGGRLLVNSSHGDVAMASIDPRFQLEAVVLSQGGAYTVSGRALDTYLIPRRDIKIDRRMLHRSGRGIGYTKSPFAYIFRLAR